VPPEGRVAAVGIVKRQSAHLARLVDDLLEVSRVTRGLIELRKEEVPLVDAVLSAVESVRPLLREQKQKLDIDVPADLRLVADANRLVQIVANLLNNAIKYTPEGGHVSVAASGEPGWIRLVVGDTGIGIEPEMLQQVFELFRQGDASLDRSRGGLGIGLHLVERLVALHGGTISIDSPGRNLGTTVTVRLPRGEPRAALQAGDEGVPRGDGPPASTILVVDDNVDAAQSLAMLLQGDGHRVSVAYDGIEGLALARRVKPHAALLDLGLPGMNGFELARQMRMDPELADVAIVAVSGYGQASDRERSAQAGFDAHLLKPVGLDDLYRALAGALAARGARRG
jgi:CheY-like chemotaxis protein/two-component sensor histidine kinase